MAIPEVDKSLTKALREIPEKGKSENGRIDTGDLWWAWVDLNHRPRPYQGHLWCYMHSNYRVWVVHSALDRMLGHVLPIKFADVVERKVLLGNESRIKKRCHKNVMPRLHFRVAGSFQVAADGGF